MKRTAKNNMTLLQAMEKTVEDSKMEMTYFPETIDSIVLMT